MKRLSLTCVLVLALLPFPVEPVIGADREHQQIMADIRKLEQETARLHLMLGSLGNSVQTLLAALEAQADDVRRAFADQRLLVDDVTGGVRIVREKVDETNVRISSLSQEFEALRMAVPVMLQSQPPLDPDDPDAELAGNLVAPAAPMMAIAPGSSPRRLYDTAYADYTTGQWALSIQGFEAYISTFPRSDLSDDAQFFIGQNYYADGSFQDAADAFDRVVLNYPNGDVVAEALYKRGLALERLEEPDSAREVFELVVENYPDNNMSNLAQQALDRLAQGQQ
ncbi:MAG: tol-pal system protein YbgF [Acidobacteria bacterium]|nr:tol-pal system protein YbgF [Acidobacteriota bacterium]|tara:strand:+ start:9305 stop:10150 length:846 start_codon:yes stop_codon:yes gene_type:complete